MSNSRKIANLLGGASIALASVLAGCSDNTVEISESSWMITNIYIDPDSPHVISDLVVNQPTIDFGQSSISGFSGCAPFRGDASFLKENQATNSSDADYLTFSAVEFDQLPEECQGQERIVHDRLTALLSGSFDISRISDTEILLTSDTDVLDRPAIRLMSWVTPD